MGYFLHKKRERKKIEKLKKFYGKYNRRDEWREEYENVYKKENF
jgi:hypothetical protein